MCRRNMVIDHVDYFVCIFFMSDVLIDDSVTLTACNWLNASASLWNTQTAIIPANLPYVIILKIMLALLVSLSMTSF